jgi:transcriptional regulator with XRE-family HTH domain
MGRPDLWRMPGRRDVDRRTELAREAVSTAVLSRRGLAAETELSYDAFRAWEAGRRRPTAASLERLAGVLDARADRLRRLADRLRREARAEGGQVRPAGAELSAPRSTRS